MFNIHSGPIYKIHLGPIFLNVAKYNLGKNEKFLKITASNQLGAIGEYGTKFAK